MKAFQNKPANDWNVIPFPVQPLKAVKTPPVTLSQVVGIVGLIMVQLNVLAAVFGVFSTGNHIPVSGLLFIMVACLCFLFNCIKEKLWLYTLCNAGTLAGNAVILLVVILRG